MRPRIRVGDYEFDQAGYSQQSAGDLLGVTRQHVAELERSGRLRVVRLGRRVVVPASEIARILSEAAGAA